MAGLAIRRSAGTLPAANEKKVVPLNINVRVPRRKLTLLTITLLLNTLHWSSFICLFTSIYQITVTPDDRTSIPSEVLTLLSALVTISYTYFHTIVSFKQRTWIEQRKQSSAIKQTTHLATRLAITLCVLWLLTSGWNMIIVARRPVCMPVAPGLQVWEMGTVCHVARLGIALAVVSLVASCLLFGVLAVVRRPFEAHLFKHGYERPDDPFATPSASRGASPIRPSARTLDKRSSRRRPSISSRRSCSNSDIDTIDLNHSPAPPTILSPFPQRSVGLGIFTSDFAPPPIPPQFRLPLRSSSLDSLTPLFPPSPQRILTRPPRLSGNNNNSGLAPLSIAPQFSASTLRAVHPPNPSMLQSSQSHPHLSSAVLSNRSHFSQSSLSLVKPQGINTVTTNDNQSLLSVSTGVEELDVGSTCHEDIGARTLGEEIALALEKVTLTSGTARPTVRGKCNKRPSSAPDVAPGAQESPKRARVTISWQPQLTNKAEDQESSQPVPEVTSATMKLAKIVHSSSAELRSRFSPDSSPDTHETNPRRQLEQNLDIKARVMKELPFRRSRSAGANAHADVDAGAQRSSIVEAVAAMVSKMPQDLLMPKPKILRSGPMQRRHVTLNDGINKPLPPIAKL